MIVLIRSKSHTHIYSYFKKKCEAVRVVIFPMICIAVPRVSFKFISFLFPDQRPMLQFFKVVHTVSSRKIGRRSLDNSPTYGTGIFFFFCFLVREFMVISATNQMLETGGGGEEDNVSAGACRRPGAE